MEKQQQKCIQKIEDQSFIDVVSLKADHKQEWEKSHQGMPSGEVNHSEMLAWKRPIRKREAVIAVPGGPSLGGEREEVRVSDGQVMRDRYSFWSGDQTSEGKLGSVWTPDFTHWTTCILKASVTKIQHFITSKQIFGGTLGICLSCMSVELNRPNCFDFL